MSVRLRIAGNSTYLTLNRYGQVYCFPCVLLSPDVEKKDARLPTLYTVIENRLRLISVTGSCTSELVGK